MWPGVATARAHHWAGSRAGTPALFSRSPPSARPPATAPTPRQTRASRRPATPTAASGCPTGAGCRGRRRRSAASAVDLRVGGFVGRRGRQGTRSGGAHARRGPRPEDSSTRSSAAAARPAHATRGAPSACRLRPPPHPARPRRPSGRKSRSRCTSESAQAPTCGSIHGAGHSAAGRGGAAGVPVRASGQACGLRRCASGCLASPGCGPGTARRVAAPHAPCGTFVRASTIYRMVGTSPLGHAPSLSSVPTRPLVVEPTSRAAGRRIAAWNHRPPRDADTRCTAVGVHVPTDAPRPRRTLLRSLATVTRHGLRVGSGRKVDRHTVARESLCGVRSSSMHERKGAGRGEIGWRDGWLVGWVGRRMGRRRRASD